MIIEEEQQEEEEAMVVMHTTIEVRRQCETRIVTSGLRSTNAHLVVRCRRPHATTVSRAQYTHKLTVH